MIQKSFSCIFSCKISINYHVIYFTWFEFIVHWRCKKGVLKNTPLKKIFTRHDFPCIFSDSLHCRHIVTYTCQAYIWCLETNPCLFQVTIFRHTFCATSTKQSEHWLKNMKGNTARTRVLKTFFVYHCWNEHYMKSYKTGFVLFDSRILNYNSLQ